LGTATSPHPILAAAFAAAAVPFDASQVLVKNVAHAKAFQRLAAHGSLAQHERVAN
jgi:hypothetical protein